MRIPLRCRRKKRWIASDFQAALFWPPAAGFMCAAAPISASAASSSGKTARANFRRCTNRSSGSEAPLSRPPRSGPMKNNRSLQSQNPDHVNFCYRPAPSWPMKRIRPTRSKRRLTTIVRFAPSRTGRWKNRPLQNQNPTSTPPVLLKRTSREFSRIFRASCFALVTCHSSLFLGRAVANGVIEQRVQLFHFGLGQALGLFAELRLLVAEFRLRIAEH